MPSAGVLALMAVELLLMNGFSVATGFDASMVNCCLTVNVPAITRLLVGDLARYARAYRAVQVFPDIQSISHCR